MGPRCRLLLVTLLAVASASAQTFITVPGVGDGVTDNTQIINDTLAAAYAARSAIVYFPRWGSTSNYLVSTVSSSASLNWFAQLLHYTTTPWSVSIVCEPGVTITGAMPTTAPSNGQPVVIFDIEGSLTNSTISGCNLVGTGNTTANRYATMAVQILGGSSQSATNNTIKNNTFHNFSRMVVASGVTGLVVQGNAFNLDNHDFGTTGTNIGDVNVGFWCVDSVSTGGGYCSGIQIVMNNYNGCFLGSAGTSSNTCGDGFIYGMYRDVVISDNTISGFSEEGIYLFADSTDTGGKTISGNNLNGSMISGDTARHGGGYAIRVDTDNSVVTGNVITNCRNGIWSDRAATGLGAAITVSANKVSYTTASPQTLESGIGLTGYNNADVSANQIHVGSGITLSSSFLAGIYLTGLSTTPSANYQIRANSVIFDTVPASGATGAWVQLVLTTDLIGNTFTGVNTCYEFQNSVTNSNARLIGNRRGCATVMVLSLFPASAVSDQDGFAINNAATSSIGSAATISPISYITHITGTTSITTITPPIGFSGSGNGGCLIFIADAATSYVGGSGNISNTFTATAGSFVTGCFDGTTWYLH